MRFITLLLALVILGYVIILYLDSTGMSDADDKAIGTSPQQTLEQTEQTAAQFEQALQNQQQRLNNTDQK
jgi:uncharacterized membrane protein